MFLKRNIGSNVVKTFLLICVFFIAGTSFAGRGTGARPKENPDNIELDRFKNRYEGILSFKKELQFSFKECASAQEDKCGYISEDISSDLMYKDIVVGKLSCFVKKPPGTPATAVSANTRWSYLLDSSGFNLKSGENTLRMECSTTRHQHRNRYDKFEQKTFKEYFSSAGVEFESIKIAPKKEEAIDKSGYRKDEVEDPRETVKPKNRN